jgi:hypothetical protein
MCNAYGINNNLLSTDFGYDERRVKKECGFLN